MTTITQARDAINTAVRTPWLANPTSAPVMLAFDDVAFDKPGADDNGRALPYAVVTVRHFEGGADTLGGVGVGKQLHEGQVVVQIFTSYGGGNALSDQLAEIAKKALQLGTIPDGWFFGTKVNEIGQDGNYRLVHVIARFRYTETL